MPESGVTRTDPENSRPLDFETFVPNHDPSLAQPSQAGFETYAIPPAPGEPVDRDEAFNRALGAMYWAGYWTAVYHVSLHSPHHDRFRSHSTLLILAFLQSHGRDDGKCTVREIAANGYDEKKEDEKAESEEEDEELLISTQR